MREIDISGNQVGDEGFAAAIDYAASDPTTRQLLAPNNAITVS
jgi:hypothetical protein